MKKVKITSNCRGSNDGINVVDFKEGDIVEVGDDLARVFVEEMNTAEYTNKKDQRTEWEKSADEEAAASNPVLINMEWASNANFREVRDFTQERLNVTDTSRMGLLKQLRKLDALVDEGGYKG